MNDQQKQKVSDYVQQVIAGAKLESNKFEFKRAWYKFKEQKSKGVDFYKNEFLKDICAVANAYGGEDGYIVIGIDEGDKSLHQNNIEDSGLNQNEIKNLLQSSVDRAFSIDIDYIEVNGIQLSVIHIPISLDKPHLIIDYVAPSGDKSRNVIFVRSGSGTSIASKGDVDRMYWERKNLAVDRRADVTMQRTSLAFTRYTELSRIGFSSAVLIENTGTRPLSIVKLICSLDLSPIKVNSQSKFSFSTDDMSAGAPLLTIDPNKIEQINKPFISQSLGVDDWALSGIDRMANQLKHTFKFERMILVLSSGEEVLPTLNVR